MTIANHWQDGITDDIIDTALRRAGIECNYVNGVWSGVSLERFRSIARAVATDYLNYSKTSLPSWALGCGYAFPIISHFVWDKAITKKCLLEYILAIESSSERLLLLDSCTALREDGSTMQREWLSCSFSGDFINSDIVETCSTRLFHNPSVNCNIDPFQDLSDCSFDRLTDPWSRSMEVLAVSVYRERVFKQPVKLGRYALPNGLLRPDCVEVVVREVLDALVFNGENGTLDPDLLPASSVPELKAFYTALKTGTLTDAPLVTHDIKVAKKKTDTKLFCTESEQTTAGAAWFSLCSNLDGCTYLSETSDGIRYELKPGLANVCRVLGKILGAKQDWHSLKNLEEFWNVIASCNSKLATIETTERILSFRAPMSDTETIHREIGMIHLSTIYRRISLEIELEAAHNLASVKQSSRDQGLWVGALFKRQLKYWRHMIWENGQKLEKHNFFGILLIHSAILGDHMTDICLKDVFFGAYERSSKRELALHFIFHSLVSTRWGEDRRNAQITDSSGAVTIATAAVATDAVTATENGKKSVLFSIRALSLNHNINLRIPMLLWLLSEVPADTDSEDLAAALLSLPNDLTMCPVVLKLLMETRDDFDVLMAMIKPMFSENGSIFSILRTGMHLSVFRIVRILNFHIFGNKNLNIKY